MAVKDGFALDADITVSELRQDELLTKRLNAHHRLRVRRRNEIVGVLVDDDEWRSLMAYIEKLEAELERAEDAAVSEIVSRRAPRAQPVHGTPEVIAEIDRMYRALIGE